jgi:EmrB/QacA subfamily drug resistance transporter
MIRASKATGFDLAYKWKVLAVVGSGVYMATLDSGIVNVALPVLTREFGAPLVEVQWIILGYVLCIAGLLLPAGRLADMVGRREVFLAGFVLFGASSALCGLAPSVPLLIGARVLQGIGGALVQANTAALLTAAFPSTERGRALGLNGSIVSTGLLTGPVLGGLITRYLGWRWAFFVNVPIAALATVVGARLLRPSPTQRDQRFDPLGALLFLLTAVFFLLGLNQGAAWGWTDPRILTCFSLAIVLGIAFIRVEQRVSHPTVDLQLFRNRGFAAAASAGFLSFLAISPVNLLMPFYLQLVLGLPVDQSGLLLISIPATVVFLAPVSGTLSDRLGTRLIASIGLAVEAVGLLSLVFLPQTGSPFRAAASLVLVGIGLALFQSPNSSSLFAAVPVSRFGVVGGFMALTRNLGSSIGQALAGAVWSIVTLAAASAVAAHVSTATEAPPDAMMAGIRTVFSLSVVFSLAAGATSVFGRGQAPQSK